MSKLKVVLNSKGIREMLRSQEMQSICEEYASNALTRLGDGYAMDSYRGSGRVNAMVYADSYAAKKENIRKNTILKAVRGK
jgi:hypothetical protein